MLTEEQRAENRKKVEIATANAKKVLKHGDRIRAARCGGYKATYTFECWDGKYWIMSKSGINDISARCIDRVNGKPVDFCTS